MNFKNIGQTNMRTPIRIWINPKEYTKFTGIQNRGWEDLSEDEKDNYNNLFKFHRYVSCKYNIAITIMDRLFYSREKVILRNTITDNYVLSFTTFKRNIFTGKPSIRMKIVNHNYKKF